MKKRINSIICILSLSILIITFTGCGGGGGGAVFNTPVTPVAPVAVKSTIGGQVLYAVVNESLSDDVSTGKNMSPEQSFKPLANAQVTILNKLVVTDSEGYFRIDFYQNEMSSSNMQVAQTVKSSITGERQLLANLKSDSSILQQIHLTVNENGEDSGENPVEVIEREIDEKLKTPGLVEEIKTLVNKKIINASKDDTKSEKQEYIISGCVNVQNASFKLNGESIPVTANGTTTWLELINSPFDSIKQIFIIHNIKSGSNKLEISKDDSWSCFDQTLECKKNTSLTNLCISLRKLNEIKSSEKIIILCESGKEQTIEAGKKLNETLKLRVVNEDGKGLKGIKVLLKSEEGFGNFENSQELILISDWKGYVECKNWTSGKFCGTQSIKATINSSSNNLVVNMNIIPPSYNEIKLILNEKLTAGTKYNVVLEVLDADNNIVEYYNEKKIIKIAGNGLNISGDQEIQFNNGTASLELMATKTGIISLELDGKTYEKTVVPSEKNIYSLSFVSIPEAVNKNVIIDSVNLQLMDEYGNSVKTDGISVNLKTDNQVKLTGDTTVKTTDGIASFNNIRVSGTGIFKFIAETGGKLCNSDTVKIKNITPVISEITGSEEINEDTSALYAISGTDADGDNLQYIMIQKPEHGVLEGSSNAWRYTPEKNYNGNDSFSFKVNDGETDSAVFTKKISVLAVNDLPVISEINNVQISEDSDVTTVGFTVSDIDSTNLEVTVLSNNNSLITESGLILENNDNDYTLKITPESDSNGISEITVKVVDGDETIEEKFNVAVDSVNDSPVLEKFEELVIDEDSVDQKIQINCSDSDNNLEDLKLNFTSADKDIFPESNCEIIFENNTWFLKLTPAADKNGSSEFSIKVSDGIADVSEKLNIIVRPVNDAPVLEEIADVEIPEDYGQKIISIKCSDNDNEKSELNASYTCSNEELFPESKCRIVYESGSWNMNIIPAENKNGVAEFTVKISDAFLESSKRFTVTVSPVNDAPYLNRFDPLVIDEDSGFHNILIDYTDIDTEATDMQFDILNRNTQLFSNADCSVVFVDGKHYLRIKSVENMTGEGNFGVTVSDGENSSDTNLSVNVTPVNDAPVFEKIEDLTISEDSGYNQFNFKVSDFETRLEYLEFSCISSNTDLIENVNVYDNSEGKFIKFLPVADRSGQCEITINATDGELTSSEKFTVTVSEVNDAPVFNAFNALTIEEDAGFQKVLINYTDIDTADENMNISFETNNSELFPVENCSIVYEENRHYLKIKSAENKYGNANFTVSVNDGEFSRTTNLSVIVVPVNDAPALEITGNTTFNEDDEVCRVKFVYSDIDSEIDTENIIVSSDDENLIVENTLVLEHGEEGNFIRFTPVANGNGSFNLTLAVSDGENNSQVETNIMIQSVNDAPVISEITEKSFRAGVENTFNFIISDVETSVDQLTLQYSSSDETVIQTSNISHELNDGTVTMTVTPVAEIDGNTVITISLSDGEETTIKEVNCSVRQNSAPVITRCEFYSDIEMIAMVDGYDSDKENLTFDMKIYSDESMSHQFNIGTVNTYVRTDSTSNEEGNFSTYVYTHYYDFRNQMEELGIEREDNGYPIFVVISVSDGKETTTISKNTHTWY